MSVKPKAELLGKQSSQKPRITSIEGNKISCFKTGKIAHSLSSLKTLRYIGANMVLATSLHQKEANSMAKSGQNTEIQSPTASKNDHLTSSGDNQKPSTPFLKRKATEVCHFYDISPFDEGIITQIIRHPQPCFVFIFCLLVYTFGASSSLGPHPVLYL
ncbi:hypothetical protein Lalb_Chr16g0384221 [Lupinus albus]|uniref:Uncharacterized protein n=1 Tax=Lupinus albus TaxID=3870 RepID=A0A6A4P3I1_LUPAL|nr:hypothetical protein Lalb_Chr16g0384221 [Lupinus albus]